MSSRIGATFTKFTKFTNVGKSSVDFGEFDIAGEPAVMEGCQNPILFERIYAPNHKVCRRIRSALTCS